MGFDEDAVERTAHLSTEKDIVDFLISFQELKNRGLDVKCIDVSLEAYPNDIENASKFCTHFSSFLEFGFDPTLIKNALVTYQNDKDKALEALLEGNIV